MKGLYKILAFVLSISMLMFIFSACSGKDDTEIDSGAEKNEDEINAKYEDIINGESENELLSEDYNPILNNFTTADFQFTMIDDTLAFNLAENSFTKISADGAAFGFHDTSLPSDYFSGSFKNAKGVAISSTVGELVASYKLGQESYSTDEAGITTFAFATDGNFEFSTLSADDALKVLKAYNDAASSSKDCAEAVMNNFVKYSTLALVTIAQDEGGAVREFAMYRFDKPVQE